MFGALEFDSLIPSALKFGSLSAFVASKICFDGAFCNPKFGFKSKRLRRSEIWLRGCLRDPKFGSEGAFGTPKFGSEIFFKILSLGQNGPWPGDLAPLGEEWWYMVSSDFRSIDSDIFVLIIS